MTETNTTPMKVKATEEGIEASLELSPKYSVWKGIFKVLIEAIIWLGPIAIEVMPEAYANLTLSAAIRLALNYAKVRAQSAGMI